MAKASATTGALVGNLGVVGASGTATFSLTNSAGSKYQVSGSQLQVGTTALTAGQNTITLHATGLTPAIADTNFIIFVYALATLSSGTASVTGTTTATIGVTTDSAPGTLYWTVDTSSTSPSYAQVAAGQDHTGAAAVKSGSAAVAATGAQTVLVTGLTPGTTYYAHFAQGDPAGNQSNIVTTASFTEYLAPANTVLPSISGTEQVGWALDGADGTWTGTPDPTLTRQWNKNGVAILGATSTSYTPVDGDIGYLITFTVAGTSAAGVAVATSNPVGPITAASGSLGVALEMDTPNVGFELDTSIALAVEAANTAALKEDTNTALESNTNEALAAQ